MLASHEVFDRGRKRFPLNGNGSITGVGFFCPDEDTQDGLSGRDTHQTRRIPTLFNSRLNCAVWCANIRTIEIVKVIVYGYQPGYRQREEPNPTGRATDSNLGVEFA